MVPGFRRLRVVLKLLLQRSSRRWSRAVFDSQPQRACGSLCQLLLRRTRSLQASSHFYLGQFSFFSAQILSLMVLIRLPFIDGLASAFSRFFDQRVDLETSRA
jgi:hypothetical protein